MPETTPAKESAATPSQNPPVAVTIPTVTPADRLDAANQLNITRLIPLDITDSIACELPPAGMPATLNDEPVFYYWREIAHTGKFYKHATKQNLDIDAATLEHWYENGKAYLAAGNSIPFNCDHSLRASESLGYIVDFRIDGSSLMMLEQIIGDEARKIAASNKVSPGIAETLVDPAKRVWTNIIYHASAVQIPLITGQNQETIAATLTAAGVTGEITLPAIERIEASMSTMNLPISQEHYDMLCSMVPDLAKIPREMQMAHAVGHIKACFGRGSYSNETAASGVVEGSAIDPAKPSDVPTFRIPTADDAEDATSAIEAKLDKAPIDPESRKVLAGLLGVDEKGNVSIGLAKRPGVKRLSILVADAIAGIKMPEVEVTTGVNAGMFARSTGGRTAGQGTAAEKPDVNVDSENVKVYSEVLASQQKVALDEANSLRRMRGLPPIVQ